MTPEERAYGLALLQGLWPLYKELALENGKLRAAMEISASHRRGGSGNTRQDAQPEASCAQSTSLVDRLNKEVANLRDQVFVLEMQESCRAARRSRDRHMPSSRQMNTRAKMLAELRLTAAQLCAMIPGGCLGDESV